MTYGGLIAFIILVSGVHTSAGNSLTLHSSGSSVGSLADLLGILKEAYTQPHIMHVSNIPDTVLHVEYI